MSYCTNCGNKMNPSDKFCSKCGHRVEATEEKKSEEVQYPEPLEFD